MILSYIRKNQCKRLFYPLMLLGVVIFLVWRSPVTEYVTKRTISNAVLINDSMAKKVLYAKIKTGTLYYSGEDCLAGGELVGHYYYELIGGSCHFYLINCKLPVPAAYLKISSRLSACPENSVQIDLTLISGMRKRRYPVRSQGIYHKLSIILNKRVRIMSCL